VDVTQEPSIEIAPDDSVEINATLTDATTHVAKATLNCTYSNISTTWVESFSMLQAGLDVWSVTVPAQPLDTNITYCIIAEDEAGNTVTTDELGYELQYQVIPEFPSIMILPSFAVVTLLLALILRKRCPLNQPRE
jgi:hypothetical protein